MRDTTPMAPVHTFPFFIQRPSNKYSNLNDHNISTVPFTRYLFTYPDINVAMHGRISFQQINHFILLIKSNKSFNLNNCIFGIMKRKIANGEMNGR
jgi:hypothetical protein